MSPALRAKLAWAVRVALAALFVWAALPKLEDPAAFATAISNYQVLPQASGLLAVLVPISELVIAFGLLIPRLQRGGALLAALLLGVFAVAMAQARARGIDLRCGCFNAALEAKVSWWTVARSGSLCALSSLLFMASGSNSENARGEERDPPVISP